MLFGEFAQILEGIDAGFVTVRKMKIQRVTPDDRGRIDRQIVRNAFVLEHFLARPFVDARSARAFAPQIGGVVTRLGVVRPFYRDFALAFFDDLYRFYHNGGRWSVIGGQKKDRKYLLITDHRPLTTILSYFQRLVP